MEEGGPLRDGGDLQSQAGGTIVSSVRTRVSKNSIHKFSVSGKFDVVGIGCPSNRDALPVQGTDILEEGREPLLQLLVVITEVLETDQENSARTQALLVVADGDQELG